jgi:DNA-binding response OmpR family regulator
MDRILIVDNDSAVLKVLRRMLVSAGFEVATAVNGETAISSFNAETPKVVILEPRTPGSAGNDLCREIRRRSASVPILVLSAAKAEIEKVLLLELGADDYITKPFSPRELLARVRAAIRRQNQKDVRSEESCSFGDVTVNFLSMEVLRQGVAVRLTPQEFKMLHFFLSNDGRVISEHELLQEVWSNRTYPSSRTIATHILRLRRKLEKEPANPVHFRTVHGAGYKFVK